MILYNTLVGFCAGLAMILTAKLIQQVRPAAPKAEPKPDSGRVRGYGFALLAVGAPLTVLSLALTLTWPLNANPPVNIAFGEPTLMLGILALLAGAHSVRTTSPVVNITPVVWLVHALGWMLASIASAILSYNLIGDAPAQEPITGQWSGWENSAFGIVYLIAAAGCLAAPLALRNDWQHLITRWSFLVAGYAFLAFSVLNYRTHIGLLLNLSRPGEDYNW